MLTIHVTIHLKPGCADDFIQASLGNHTGSRQEPGNQRWDVLQDSEDPNVFYLYEAYADEAALEAHRQTPHYLTWRETVTPMMAKPRTLTKAQVIFPSPWS